MRMRGLRRSGQGGVAAEAEVFPRLERFILAGMAFGAVLAGVPAWWVGAGPSATLVRGVQGGLAVGLMGLFVGMSRAVKPPRPAIERRDDLWDPWVDSASSPEPGEPEPEPEPACVAIVAERARVRPRVLTAEGESMSLEDEIRPLLEAGECGAVRIVGGDGSGKTTALRHLAASFPPLSRTIILDDEPDVTTIAAAASRGLVIYVSKTSTYPKHLAVFSLTPWGDDELIEYLLTIDASRRGSVMARLKTSNDRGFLRGIPDLWRIVLDRMAADETVESGRQALRLALEARMPDPAVRTQIGETCLADPEAAPGDVARKVLNDTQDEVILRLTRHRPVQHLLAADRIASALSRVEECDFLSRRLPRALVEEAASRISADACALEHLRLILGGGKQTHQAMAASLLHAARGGWRPESKPIPWLAWAYLERVQWTGLDLSDATLSYASMARADLSRAVLSGANLALADLSRADLASCVADRADFRMAVLTDATLEHASLRDADLMDARLMGANLSGANLAAAKLVGASIEGADFTGANLEGARLGLLRLSRACFTGARFGAADLSGCDLEGMELPDVDFEDAILSRALLTGSRMPGARFLRADLRDTGLAEIDWPDACLREANLLGASFHLGSSRSGLVGSPIASEGSRTGFYTALG